MRFCESDAFLLLAADHRQPTPKRAFTPNSLFAPDWKEKENPWVIGRKLFGGIAIANSDVGANAYTDEAINHAYRAVQELPRS